MKISMKKRKIGYTYGSVSGKFSFRGEKIVEFESLLEKDLLTILEFNDTVSDVIEQPFTIEYINEKGKPASYTPDFLVYFKLYGLGTTNKVYPKPLLIEVKPRKILKKRFNEFRPKFKAAISYTMQNDMIFKIYDESRIHGVYYDNVKKLKKYIRQEYNKLEEEKLLERLQLLGHTSIECLIEHLAVTDEQKGITLGQIYHLIATKKIGCDFTYPITLNTTIWLNMELV